MEQTIHVIGTNFKMNTLDRVGLIQWSDKAHITPFLKKVRATLGAHESFFLQTCNRREFYFNTFNPKNTGFAERFLAMLGDEMGTELHRDAFYHYRGREAAKHLFRVASSLDSMVIGETEIMKQIKDQASAARKDRNMGRWLKAMVDTALWSAKQVRRETNITKNVVSMASLAYRTTTDYLAGKARKRLVFVGAGHFIESILPTFTKSEDIEFFFVNRTAPDSLAQRYGGKAISLASFLADPIEFDAMITATGAAEALFKRAWLEARGHEMLIIDVALPGDVEAAATQTPGVTYHGLSGMEATLAHNRSAREAEIPKAEPLFEEGIRRLEAQWLECDLAAYNRQISKHYRDAGEKALSSLISQELPNLSEQEQARIREWTHTLVGKLTNIPILGLKGVAKEMGHSAVEAYTKNIAANSPLFRTDQAP